MLYAMLADTTALATVQRWGIRGIYNFLSMFVSVHVALHSSSCFIGHGVRLEMGLHGSR